MVPRFLVLLFLVFLVYAPAYHGELIWDDADGYVAKNDRYHSVDGLRRIWFEPAGTQYYPLVFTSFWIEYQFWQLDTLGYHLINIFWHGMNAGLVWLVLRRLQVPGAWLAAAAFALHPVHVESVAWISERKNVLSGFFYLTSLLAFLRFSPFEETRTLRDPGWGWFALSLVLFVAALLSKTVTCSLPAVLILLYGWKGRWPTRREIAALTPMFLLGLCGALMTSYVERHLVGAQGEGFDLSPIQRCLIAGRALWFYAGKLFFPYPLMFNYPRWHVDPEQAWQWAFPVAALAAMALLAWSTSPRFWNFLGVRPVWGRGPLTAVLIFAGTLVPALGFVNVYPMKWSFVADHFQYLASVPLLALAVGSVVGWVQTSARSPDSRIAVTLGGGVLLGVLGWLTFEHAALFAGPDTLWRDTIVKNPDSVLANFNYGTRCLARGDLATAIACFERTERVDPRSAGLYVNWGIALGQQGQFAAAIDKFRQAIANNPQDSVAQFNLGFALLRMRRPQEAVPYFETAIQLDPKDGHAHLRLGEALAAVGREQDAVAPLMRAAELLPGNAEVWQLLDRIRKGVEDRGRRS